MATKEIVWKLNLRSSPKSVFELLNTDRGREKFWCEKSSEVKGKILFEFPNGMNYSGRILDRDANHLFGVTYFDATVWFELKENKEGGTDLKLTNSNVPEAEYVEVKAGWVSVLMNLKAVADYGVDLRNHDSSKTWDEGYLEN